MAENWKFINTVYNKMEDNKICIEKHSEQEENKKYPKT